MTPETFLDNFGAIANAPGGVQRLRDLILQLAIQGKLVAQNPEDESVNSLLEKIESEKEELVKSKAIRNLRKLDPIRREEQYIDIPASWRWVRLQTVGNIFNGNSVNAKVKEEKYFGNKNGLPFIATKDVEYGFQSLNYENGVKIPVDEPSFKMAHKNAVLICAEGGSAGKKCGITDQDIFFGNKLFALELYGALEPKFFLSLYLSPSFSVAFQRLMTGIIGGISLANFSAIPVPLPSLSEQKRIVAKVDQLMSLCDTLEQQQQKCSELLANARSSALSALSEAQGSNEIAAGWKRVEENLAILFEKPEDVEDLKKCILQNAVMGKLVPQNPDDEPASELLKKIAAEKAELVKKGDIKKGTPLPSIRDDEKPFKLPNGWEWCRLPEVGELNRGRSKHRPRNDIKLYLNGTIPLIQTGDVARSNGKITTYTALYNEIGLKQSKRWPKGTLCITIAANIADTGILDFDACFPDSVVGFIPITGYYGVEYFDFFIRTAKDHLEKFAPSTAQKNINLEILGKLLIPIPPLVEQYRIVAETQSLLALCDRLQATLTKYRAIAEQLTQSVVESLTGISTEKKETMKIPKTELVTKLVLVKKPGAKDIAPLSSILSRNNDSMSAKALWNVSGLSIDEFYKHLKAEMIAGWIDEPKKAEIHIVAEKVAKE